jgi:hypothetical protein
MIEGSFLPAKIAGDSFQLFVGSVGVRSFVLLFFFYYYALPLLKKPQIPLHTTANWTEKKI